VRLSAAVLLLAVLSAPVASATAQFGAAKKAAQQAVGQTNTHTTAMQQPTAAAQAPAGTKAAPGARTTAQAGGPASGTKTGGLTVASENSPAKAPVIMREVFVYDPAGRRDPFFSLLTTDELRPTVADLRLVGVLYDESGRRPVAIMRDVLSNTQYRVTTGMTLGRMRVAAIKRRSVVFSIEEFGTNRQDSLVLGDTTKVRAR
jgi:hypothetical protein